VHRYGLHASTSPFFGKLSTNGSVLSRHTNPFPPNYLPVFFPPFHDPARVKFFPRCFRYRIARHTHFAHHCANPSHRRVLSGRAGIALSEGPSGAESNPLSDETGPPDSRSRSPSFRRPARWKTNKAGEHRKSTNQSIVELVRDLSKILSAKAIAPLLNRVKLKTGCGNNWTEDRVRALKNHNGIKPCTQDNEIVTLQQAAERLGICSQSVRGE